MNNSDACVIVRREGALGRLTLNRPEALHALNLPMVTIMLEALIGWRDDATITAVLLDHQGARGFCAGGDIRMLAESGAGDSSEAKAFFHAEYQLNHVIATYPKPYIAVIDGVTMGGGVGISVHGTFRIATERTVFAMPETGIGLFPDVGGSWFLPRIEGEIGTWLALTGTRLRAADCCAIGVATHFVPSELLGAVKAQISGAAETHSPIAALRSGLAALEEEPGPVKELTAEVKSAINRCFVGNDVSQMKEALRLEATEWADAQLTTLATKSPQTLKVALRQLRAGKTMTRFDEAMAMEYRIGARVVGRHDFLEGVRALIVDKDNAPKWSPATLEGVDDALLDTIFAPLADDDEWVPLS